MPLRMVAGSVFIDEVTVTPILLGEPVKLANPSFDAADRGSKDYKYIIPRGWRGTGRWSPGREAAARGPPT